MNIEKDKQALGEQGRGGGELEGGRRRGWEGKGEEKIGRAHV